jgi:hypothetical protein
MNGPLAALSLVTFAVSGCASTGPSDDAGSLLVQREYRTGSRFPVKDSAPPMTQQVRDRQIDDARNVVQSSPNQQPRGVKGQ